MSLNWWKYVTCIRARELTDGHGVITAGCCCCRHDVNSDDDDDVVKSTSQLYERVHLTSTAHITSHYIKLKNKIKLHLHFGEVTDVLAWPPNDFMQWIMFAENYNYIKITQVPNDINKAYTVNVLASASSFSTSYQSLWKLINYLLYSFSLLIKRRADVQCCNGFFLLVQLTLLCW